MVEFFLNARLVPLCRVTCANPGTEPVAETAAAMTVGYLVFKDHGKQND